MSRVLDFVRRGLAVGRLLLPVSRLEKATRFKNWSTPEVRATIEHFAPDSNVAERLDNVVDIDCDCHEARFIADRLLPTTARKHGRPSLLPPFSHYWYTVSGEAQGFKAYCDLWA